MLFRPNSAGDRSPNNVVCGSRIIAVQRRVQSFFRLLPGQTGSTRKLTVWVLDLAGFQVLHDALDLSRRDTR